MHAWRGTEARFTSSDGEVTVSILQTQLYILGGEKCSREYLGVEESDITRKYILLTQHLRTAGTSGHEHDVDHEALDRLHGTSSPGSASSRRSYYLVKLYKVAVSWILGFCVCCAVILVAPPTPPSPPRH